MRRALFALLLIAGCKKADGIVVLTVDASPALSSVALVHVAATAGGRTVSFDDHPAAPFTLPPSRTLGIEFPASVAGTMKLHVEARDAAGHVLGSDDVSVDTTAGVRSNVSITLGAGGGDGGSGPGDGGSGPGDGGDGGDGGGPGCVNGDGVCGAGCSLANDNDCPPVCGNGVVESGEVCDDGNTTNGDNCDPTCQFTNTLSIAIGTPSGQGRADGLGKTARLQAPTGITTDQVNVYFGDDCTVKQYNPTSTITTTIAGAWGDCQVMDGVGTAARFTAISDLEFVPNAQKGVLYIGGNSVVRKLDLMTMTVSSINGVAGEDSGNRGDGLGSSSDGSTLYLIDYVNGLRALNLANNGTTVVATAAQLLGGICSDVARFGADLYLTCGNEILKVTPNGASPTVSVFAGNSMSPPCKASTGATLTTAVFSDLNRLVVDNTGTITATDDLCHVVWTIVPGSGANPIAGTLNTAGHADSPSTGGPTTGTMSAPFGVVNVSGISYVAETSGPSDAYGRTLRSVGPFALTTLAGVPSNGVGVSTIGTSPTFDSPILIVANGNNPLVSNFSFSTSHTWMLDLMAGFDQLLQQHAGAVRRRARHQSLLGGDGVQRHHHHLPARRRRRDLFRRHGARGLRHHHGRQLRHRRHERQRAHRHRRHQSLFRRRHHHSHGRHSAPDDRDLGGHGRHHRRQGRRRRGGPLRQPRIPRHRR